MEKFFAKNPFTGKFTPVSRANFDMTFAPAEKKADPCGAKNR